MSAENWERALWKNQPHPDNYIHADISLRRNVNFRPYTYWPLVLGACSITQHLATIFIFLSVFVRLKERMLDPRILVWISVGFFIPGYVMWEFMDESAIEVKNRRATRSKISISSILIFLALIALSPVLKTLTEATSSDSIWALSASLFGLNALLADYSSVKLGGKVRERLTSVLSMNAAIASSVVLASRLPEDIAVFSLVLFSVQLFALFPMLRHRLEVVPISVQAALTLSLSVLSLTLAAPLSGPVTYLYAIILLFITFLAPAVLVWAQKYKNAIGGSWDQAYPKPGLRAGLIKYIRDCNSDVAYHKVAALLLPRLEFQARKYQNPDR